MLYVRAITRIDKTIELQSIQIGILENINGLK